MMQRLTTTEARDLGVILEVNRLLLHPRGLALEITIDQDDPDGEAILRIQDHRADGEGVYFAELDQDAIEAAHLAFHDLGRTGAPNRLAALGYIVQPFRLLSTKTGKDGDA